MSPFRFTVLTFTLPYVFLLLAVILVLFQRRKASVGAFGIAVTIGMLAGAIGIVGLFLIVLTAMASMIFQGHKSKFSNWVPDKLWVRSAAGVLFLGISLGLMNHALPGFRNFLIFKDFKFSTDALPFTMYLNFDKTLIGYLGMLFWIQVHQSKKVGFEDFKATLKTLVFLIALLIPLALWLGYVRLDPKIPGLSWIWMLNNFFFVCLAEEFLFRGVIQKRLELTLHNFRFGAWISILSSAVLFGLAHFKGGLNYVALATVSGLFYGYAFKKTGRIECSMSVHFGLNLIHFFMFSYPALALT